MKVFLLDQGIDFKKIKIFKKLLQYLALNTMIHKILRDDSFFKEGAS